MGNGGSRGLDDGALVRALKARGYTTRFRMTQAIAAAGELSCGQVADLFDVSQPTISHHLRILRDAGLVESTRHGTWAYYRLVPDAIERLRGVFEP